MVFKLIMLLGAPSLKTMSAGCQSARCLRAHASLVVDMRAGESIVPDFVIVLLKGVSGCIDSLHVFAHTFHPKLPVELRDNRENISSPLITYTQAWSILNFIL